MELNIKNPRLYDIHSLKGAIFGDYPGFIMPKSYGNPLEEYLAVRKGVGLIDLSHHGKLRVSGKEHLKFLQGMVTNDLMKLGEGKGLYATLLTVKGRMFSDMRIYRDRESILLELEPGLNEKVRELLVKYRLSYKANIEDLTDTSCLFSINGPYSKGLLKKTLREEIPELKENEFLERVINDSEIMIVRINRTGEDGYDIFSKADRAKTFWESLIENGRGLGIKLVGLDAMETLRIEAGIPRYGADMDEDTIPLEAGLLDAISFEKGCYVGQEVIARIKWRGHVNRCLVGFEIEGDTIPSKGHKIFHDEREIGHITSSVFSPFFKKVIALGYIRREFKEPGTAVLVKLNGNSKSGRIVKTPFYNSMVGGTGFEPVTSTV